MNEPDPSESVPLEHEIASALGDLSLQDLDLGAVSSAAPAGAAGDPSGLVAGVVAGVNGDDVIIDLGPRRQGVVSLREFDGTPEVGARFSFSRVGEEDGLWLLSREGAKRLARWNELRVGSWVKARVSGQNQGGLEARIESIRAFLPASQMARRRVEDLSTYIGQTLVCEVLELDRDADRVVLSRRAVLQREAEDQRRETVGSLAPGQVVRGKVTRLQPFGAFVELAPGVEGLVHVSNISRRRIEDPAEVLEVGQTVEAQVLEITEGGKRIALGTKQLEPDPWEEHAERLRPDQVLRGKVVRVVEFGAFVEVAPGVEGLLHVSQLGRDRVRRPRDVVRPDEELDVRVISVDLGARRISLSRLDARGSLIGSEDAVEDASIDEVLEQGRGDLGTNLGSLFRRALDADAGSEPGQ